MLKQTQLGQDATGQNTMRATKRALELYVSCCESICDWMVRRTVVSPAHQSESPRLTLVLAFSWIYSNPSGNVHSVGEDVRVEYEGVCGDCINLKMMCQLSHSEVLIGVGVRACVHRDEHICVCMDVCICIVFKKYM